MIDEIIVRDHGICGWGASVEPVHMLRVSLDSRCVVDTIGDYIRSCEIHNSGVVHESPGLEEILGKVEPHSDVRGPINPCRSGSFPISRASNLLPRYWTAAAAWL